MPRLLRRTSPPRAVDYAHDAAETRPARVGSLQKAGQRGDESEAASKKAGLNFAYKRTRAPGFPVYRELPEPAKCYTSYTLSLMTSDTYTPHRDRPTVMSVTSILDPEHAVRTAVTHGVLAPFQWLVGSDTSAFELRSVDAYTCWTSRDDTTIRCVE